MTSQWHRNRCIKISFHACTRARYRKHAHASTIIRTWTTISLETNSPGRVHMSRVDTCGQDVLIHVHRNRNTSGQQRAVHQRGLNVYIDVCGDMEWYNSKVYTWWLVIHLSCKMYCHRDSLSTPRDTHRDARDTLTPMHTHADTTHTRTDEQMHTHGHTRPHTNTLIQGHTHI